MIDSVAKRFGGVPRSGSWYSTRNEFIKSNNECECCGSKKNLQVHHKVPFCVDPDRELDMDNLMTLCADCHFQIGHCGWWASYNPNVEESVRFYKAMLENRRVCNFGSAPTTSWLTKIVQYILRRWYHFE